MVILTTAWRNIWRQKRRTILTVTAISITTALLIFSISMQIGSYKMMIESTLKMGDGFGRIQHKDYQDTPSIRTTVVNIEQLKQQIKSSYGNVSIAAKAMSYGIINADTRSLGAQIMGVEPNFEKQFSLIPKKIVKGQFLGSNNNEIVLGETLANNLKTKVGDDIVFLGTDKQGSLAVDSLKVVGLFNTGLKLMDNNLALIPLSYFQTLLGLDNEAHYIMINSDDFQQIAEIIPKISKQISNKPELIAMDWKAIAPGVYKMIQLDLGTAIPIYFALIVVVCFGFMNTMYMSVYERTKEFGMLMAIGMRPTLISKMFFLETCLILIIGFIVGVGLGAALTHYYVVNGIFIEGTEVIYEQFGLPPRIYPILNWYTMLPAPLLITVITLITTIFPILKINKMNIVDSMRAVK